jgi:hypothetical protein
MPELGRVRRSFSPASSCTRSTPAAGGYRHGGAVEPRLGALTWPYAEAISQLEWFQVRSSSRAPGQSSTLRAEDVVAAIREANHCKGGRGG